MEQFATRSHKCHHSKYFQEQIGQDVERYGHQQLRSYLAHQLQVQVQVQGYYYYGTNNKFESRIGIH